jgi:hypothetical protein
MELESRFSSVVHVGKSGRWRGSDAGRRGTGVVCAAGGRYAALDEGIDAHPVRDVDHHVVEDDDADVDRPS